MLLENITKEELEVVTKKCRNIKDVLFELGLNYGSGSRQKLVFLIKHYKINVDHMLAKRTHKLKNITKEELQRLVDTNNSLNGIFRELDIAPVAKNYLNLRRKLELHNIPYIHIYAKHNCFDNRNTRKIPNSLVFIEKSKASMNSVKARIIKEKLLPYECAICKLTSWQDKKISLQIDHINGVGDDNRIENFRWLCPNCHAQTDTYCRRALPISKKIYSCHCGNKIGKRTLNCKAHCNNNKKPKIAWPTKEKLEELVWSKATTLVAKDLGVSDKAVEKKCKVYGIQKPERGYWAKQKVQLIGV